jgi:hypothetical protein
MTDEEKEFWFAPHLEGLILETWTHLPEGELGEESRSKYRSSMLTPQSDSS